VPVVELDPEHPVSEGLDDLSLQLELLFLLGDSLSSQMAERQTTVGTARSIEP
jgi:hypothetical protein